MTLPFAEGGPLPLAIRETLLTHLERHIHDAAHNETGSVAEFARHLAGVIESYRQTHDDPAVADDDLGKRIVDLLQAHVSGYRHGGAGHLAHLIYRATTGDMPQCTTENSRPDRRPGASPSGGGTPG